MLLIAFAAATLVQSSARPQEPAVAKPAGRFLQDRAANKSAPARTAPLLSTRVLLPTIRSARPGQPNAATFLAALAARNVAIRQKHAPPRLITAVIAKVPGVTRVNDVVSGVFEPGGTYAITGSGFGRKGGYAFLRSNKSILPMVIVAWSDELIMAKVADDISGIEDLDRVELAVTPEGKAAFNWSRYGFRAARADVTLSIGGDMFRSEPNAPGTAALNGDYLEVSRNTQDGEDQKRCIEPGVDRIRWNVPLRRGFEVTGYDFRHIAHRKTEFETPRGRYGAEWAGEDVRISFGVTRLYSPPGMWRRAYGACWSKYSLRLVATGPRGLQPTP